MATRKSPLQGEIKLCEAVVHVNGESRTCKNAALQNNSYCYQHDIKAKSISKSNQFVHGLTSTHRKRFSEVAPKLLTRIEELREDPDLWSLRDDAAYVTAIMDLRAEAVDEGVTLDHYRSIKQQYFTCKQTMGDDSFEDEFKALGELINRGVDSFEASKDVIDLIERRTEIIEAEQHMLRAKAYTLEVDQAYSLVMQIFHVVKTNVHNAEELVSIKQGIAKLLKTYQSIDEILDAEVIDEDDDQHEINTKEIEAICEA